jgi:hypothetical protein
MAFVPRRFIAEGITCFVGHRQSVFRPSDPTFSTLPHTWNDGKPSRRDARGEKLRRNSQRPGM